MFVREESGPIIFKLTQILKLSALYYFAMRIFKFILILLISLILSKLSEQGQLIIAIFHCFNNFS